MRDIGEEVKASDELQNVQLVLQGSLGSKENQVVFDVLTPLPFLGIGERRVVQVACGVAHVAFLSLSGALYSTGDGSVGQLGNASFARKSTTKAVRVEVEERIKQVCCGPNFSACLSKEGGVFVWGRIQATKNNPDVFLSFTPEPIKAAETFTQITVGNQFIVMLGEQSK